MHLPVLVLFSGLVAASPVLNLAWVEGNLTFIRDGGSVFSSVEESPLLRPSQRDQHFELRLSTPSPTATFLWVGIFAIWQAGGASNATAGATNVTLGRNGSFAGGDVVTFTATAECTEDFVGVVTWVFYAADAADGSSSVSTVSFRWKCAAPGCEPEFADEAVCEPPRGTCNYYDGVCECAPGGWVGGNCDQVVIPMFSMDEGLCPGETPRFFVHMPAPLTLYEWFECDTLPSRDLLDVCLDWRYLSAFPTYVEDESGLNLTLEIETLLDPGFNELQLYRTDSGYQTYRLTFYVKEWTECGWPDGDPTLCEGGQWGTDCSRGCAALQTVTAGEGVISSDPAAANYSEMKMALFTECEWQVVPNTSAPFDVIDVTILMLSLAEGDSLTLMQGNETIATWVGTQSPTLNFQGGATVNAKQFRLVLYGDYTSSYKGFVLSYGVRKLPLGGGAIAGIAASSVVVGLPLVAAAVLLVVLQRRRRTRIALAALNAPELDWSTEDEEKSFHLNVREAEEALRKIGIEASPRELEFGLEARRACPVKTQLRQMVTIKNSSGGSIRYAFHCPRDPDRFEIQARPGQGLIKAGSGMVIEVTLVLDCTTSVTRRVMVTFEAGGERVGECFFVMRLEGAISDKVDPKDIVLTSRTALGHGGYGRVLPGELRGRLVAVKILRVQQAITPKQLQDFEYEVDMCRKLRSPLIVEFIGASHVPGRRCIVTELIELGSLDAMLSRARIPLELQVRFARNIATAVDFLHTSRVLYRDLKPSNVLIVSTSYSAPVNSKLCDLGTARNVSDVREPYSHPCDGTPLFMAPEVISRKPSNWSADVFSFGVTLWVMQSGVLPWEGVPLWTVSEKVVAGERPPMPAECPAILAGIITASWDADPARRPTLAALLEKLDELKKVATEIDLEAAKKKKTKTADGGSRPTESVEGAATHEAEEHTGKKKKAPTTKKALKKKMRREARKQLEMAVLSGKDISASPAVTASAGEETGDFTVANASIRGRTSGRSGLTTQDVSSDTAQSTPGFTAPSYFFK